jgi:hypothetical protein
LHRFIRHSLPERIVTHRARQFYDPNADSETTPPDPPPAWDVALVCLNGHLLNDRSRGNPAGNALGCAICGAEAISACPGCRECIPGFYYAQGRPFEPAGSSSALLAKVPQYCQSCGRPFPWTERAMSAARAVIRELATLDQFERDQLRRSIDHIIRETPQTQVAILRIRQALARIGGETARQLREMLISVASEPIRKQLFPDGL